MMLLQRRHLQSLFTWLISGACIRLLSGHFASNISPMAARISLALDNAGKKASHYSDTVLLNWMPNNLWSGYRPTVVPDLLTDSRIINNTLIFAVVDATTFHEEVFGPVAYSLVSRNKQSVFAVLFRNSFRFGYEGDILARVLPDDITYHKTSQLNRWLQHVHVLFLTSGDFDLDRTRKAIRRHKELHVVVVIHHANDWSLSNPGSHTSYSSIVLLQQLARARRLSLVTLSGHVRLSLSVILYRDAPDVPWASIIDTFVPIIPVASMKGPQNEVGIISKVVVQGQIAKSRRSYNQLFNELLVAIDADPAEWGYQRNLEDLNGPFLPMRTNAGLSDRFELHLVGALQRTELPVIPPALANVIKLHPNLAFSQFYQTLSSMVQDLLLPAFKEVSDGQPSEYITNRASSSIPAAIITHVPALVTAAQAHAYDYLGEPAKVHREQDQTLVESIRDLRRQHHNATTIGAESAVSWNMYEANLHAQNDRVWQRIIERVRRQSPRQ